MQSVAPELDCFDIFSPLWADEYKSVEFLVLLEGERVLRRSEQPIGSSPAAGVHVHSLIWTPLLRWLLMSVGQIEEYTQVAGIRPEEEALP